MERMSKYTLRNKADDARASLYIYGDIVDDVGGGIYKLFGIDGVVSPTDFRKQLEAVGDKPLDVYISSDGGDVPSGLAIANMLARRKAETVGHVDGWAASIAGIIFLACCTERHMPGNTFLMLHRPSLYGFNGNIDDFQKAVEFLKTTGDSLLAFIIGRVKDKDKEDEVEQNYINEHWYNAEEAAGIFDITLDPDNTYKAAAKCKSYTMPDAMKLQFDKAIASDRKEKKQAIINALAESYGII